MTCNELSGCVTVGAGSAQVGRFDRSTTLAMGMVQRELRQQSRGLRHLKVGAAVDGRARSTPSTADSTV